MGIGCRETEGEGILRTGYIKSVIKGTDREPLTLLLKDYLGGIGVKVCRGRERMWSLTRRDDTLRVVVSVYIIGG